MIPSFREWLKEENLDAFLNQPENAEQIEEKAARTVTSYPDNYPRQCGGQGTSDKDNDVLYPPSDRAARSPRGFAPRKKG